MSLRDITVTKNSKINLRKTPVFEKVAHEISRGRIKNRKKEGKIQ